MIAAQGNAAPADSPIRDEVHAVTYLRFAAAFLVLLGHASHEATTRLIGAPEYSWPIDPGIGVDVFFVISGFVMIFASRNRECGLSSCLHFLWARVARVAPLYWIFTTLMLVSSYLFAGRVTHVDFRKEYIAASYLFLPFQRVSDGLPRPVLAVGWTLNYEAFFYLLFGLSLIITRRWVSVVVGSLLCLLISLRTLGILHGVVMTYWSDPIVFEFLAGMMVGQAFLVGIRISRLTAFGLLVAGTAVGIWLHSLGGQMRVVELGIPATLWTLAVVLYPLRPFSGRSGTLLELAGNSSYSLYLCHPFALNICSAIARRFGLSHLGFEVAAVSSAVVLAAIVHTCVERPIAGALKQIPYPSRSRLSSSSAT